MNNRRITTAITVTLLVILALLLRPKPPAEANSGYHVLMGTFARILAVAPDPQTAEAAIQLALQRMRNVDNLMSDYKEDSEISKINRDAFKAPVKVSRPTFEVLQKAIEFSELSDGAFDITIGPLVDLWRSAKEANSPPTNPQLEEAHYRIGYEKLILDPNGLTVKFAIEKMRLDLGGIAKGYAIDLAVEAMQEAGALGAMVDIGGDIRCFGKARKGKKNWRIGLQDPNVPAETVIGGEPMLVLKLGDTAVATSGGYRRFVLVEGSRQSHIIDTKTGHGSKALASVTIIAPKAVDADALATAVTVLGPEKGLALIEKTPNTEAILISPAPQYKITKTPGAQKYIKP